MQKRNQKQNAFYQYIPELCVLIFFAVIMTAWVIKNGIMPVGDDAFFEAAKAAGSYGVPMTANKLSYVYMYLLSVMLCFLGHKWTAVAILQLVLLGVGLLLVFASVRKLYGRAAAVVFLLIMSVFAVFLFNYNQITPKLLLLAAVGVVFITIKANIAESSIRCMLTGILTGMAFRLDLTVLMLGFVLIVFVLLRDRTIAAARRLKGAFFLTVGMLTALWALFAAESQLSGKAYITLVEEYVQSYAFGMEDILLLVAMAVILLMTVLSASNVFTKKMEKEENKVTEEKTISEEANYIPNPLPLPKKHVKRELKFDYEPAPEQMKFDYELKKGQEDYDLL